MNATSPANLQLRTGDEISINRAVHDAHAYIYLRLDLSRLTDDEGATLGCEFALRFTVDLQPIGEKYVSVNFYAAADPTEV
jgi:hypothetical protein